MEAARHLAAAVTWRLQGDPDQTGQQSKSCSQEEVENGWGERGGMGPAAGGHTVQEEEVEVLVSNLSARPSEKLQIEALSLVV